jgi:hypothetical protein
VLTTLGNLYHIYSVADIEDAVQTKIPSCLEKCWAAADQDPFIAAVILNPFLQERCLSWANTTLTPTVLSYVTCPNAFTFMFSSVKLIPTSNLHSWITTMGVRNSVTSFCPLIDGIRTSLHGKICIHVTKNTPKYSIVVF